jgi:hypothetical protein
MIFGIFIIISCAAIGGILIVDVYNILYGKAELFDQNLHSFERDICNLRESIHKLSISIKQLKDQLINHKYDADEDILLTKMNILYAELANQTSASENKVVNVNHLMLLQRQQEEFQTKIILELANIKLILSKFDNSSEGHSMKCHGGSFGCFSETSITSPLDLGNQDYQIKDGSSDDSANQINSNETEYGSDKL